MSNFHSTVSRRQFMKGLGLVSVGAAALSAPVFHDLDELTTSSTSNPKRPWWMKSVEKPTVEIDWSMTNRPDERTTTQTAWVNVQYFGEQKWLDMQANTATLKKQILGKKGQTLRDLALNNASTDAASGWGGQQNMYTVDQQFRGPMLAQTPQQIGLPTWKGTPEEATKMVRAAGAFFGAKIGCAEIGAAGSNDRKLIYTYSRAGSNTNQWIHSWPPPLEVCPKINQEDVDVGWHDGQVIHLPNKFLWDISIMIPMAKEAWRTAMPDSPSGVASAANISRYRLAANVVPCLQEFFRGLGYWGYGAVESGKQMLPSEASAVLSGNAEMARHSDACIDPEFGANMGYYSQLTDLELAPDNPVDAGVFRFCHSCHKCADACPSHSISQDAEPSWEVPNWDYAVKNMSNNPGKKLFWTNMGSCAMYRGIYGCNICRPSCTFNENYAAGIHSLVKETVSTTPIFNSFFWKMSKAFGYGLTDSEEWWEKSLPLYGFETNVASYNGGYRNV